jgi:DNA-binding transcriptional LysR family regulator
MNNIDIKLLRAFMVLMAERNVSRSAARLGMSQPATSHALARLRALFDDPLLLRSRAGMIPTTRAAALETSVRVLLENYENLVSPAADFDPASSHRTFVLTAPEHAEHLLMPRLLRHIRAQAPGVRVDVRPPDPERAYEMLESGQVDLRIAWLLRPMLSLRSLQLFQDRMVYVADVGHPSLKGALSLAQFLTLPHIRTFGASRNTTNRVIDDALDRLGKKLAVTFQLQNFMTVPSVLAGTDIIAPMAHALALRFAQIYPLQVLEPPIKLPRIRYAAYWHERNQNDAGHRWLRNAVVQAAQGLPS